MDEYLGSIAWFASVFNKDVKTVRKAITSNGLMPVDKVRNSHRYKIADVTPLLVEPPNGPEWEGVNPDTLAPLEQQQYWNAQKTKVQREREHDNLLRERGRLLEVDDVKYNAAALLKGIREGLLIISDVIDAEAGLSPKQRKAVDDQIDVILASAASMVANLEDPDVPES